MDLDGNGSIDAVELGLVLKSFGEAVPAGRLKALIREVGSKPLFFPVEQLYGRIFVEQRGQASLPHKQPFSRAP